MEDQCLACLICDFKTYSSSNLEEHFRLRHDGMPPKYFFIRVPEPMCTIIRQTDALLCKSRHFSTQVALRKGAEESAVTSKIINEGVETMQSMQSCSKPVTDFRTDLGSEESKPYPLQLFSSLLVDESHTTIPHIKPDPDKIQEQVPDLTLVSSDHDRIVSGHDDLEVDVAGKPLLGVDTLFLAETKLDAGDGNTLKGTIEDGENWTIYESHWNVQARNSNRAEISQFAMKPEEQTEISQFATKSEAQTEISQFAMKSEAHPESDNALHIPSAVVALPWTCNQTYTIPFPYTMDSLSRGRRLVQLSVAKSRDIVRKPLQKAADDSKTDCPAKRPRFPSVMDPRDRPWPSASTPIHLNGLNISEVVQDRLENDPEVVQDHLGNYPEFKNFSFSMIDFNNDKSKGSAEGKGMTMVDGEKTRSPFPSARSDDIIAEEQISNGVCLSGISIIDRRGKGDAEDQTGEIKDDVPKEEEDPHKSILERDENARRRYCGGERDEEDRVATTAVVFENAGGEKDFSGDKSERDEGDKVVSGESGSRIGGGEVGNRNDGEEMFATDNYGLEMDGGLSFRKNKIGRGNWKRNLSKALRERGKEYVGRSSKDEMVRARSLGGRCSCLKNGYQCKDLSDEERETIFKYVWSLTWEEKRSFVLSLTEKEKVATRTVTPMSQLESEKFRKKNTFKYFLKTASDQRRRVCRNFFLSTTGPRKWCVREWVTTERPVKPLQSSEVCVSSTRLEDRNFCVQEFFNTLPRLPSHYARANSSKLYLEPLFPSFADVYNLYTSKCKDSNRRPLCRHIVMEIFNELNLALLCPRKDQCDGCVGYDCRMVDEQVLLKHHEHKKPSLMVSDPIPKSSTSLEMSQSTTSPEMSQSTTSPEMSQSTTSPEMSLIVTSAEDSKEPWVFKTPVGQNETQKFTKVISENNSNMDHTQEKHFKSVNELCRVCARKVLPKKRKQDCKKVKPCTRYTQDILLVYGLNIHGDNENVHSKNICDKCLLTISNVKRLKSVRTIENAREMYARAKCVWVAFDPLLSVNECAVCSRDLYLRRGCIKQLTPWKQPGKQ